MTREPVEARAIWKVRDGRRSEENDWVVVEEPLDLRLGGETLAIIMRTPGHDVDLAAGFCLTEGVVRTIRDLGTIRVCAAEPEGEANVVEVTLAPGALFDRDRLRRNLMASAACGLCGKASIEALATQAKPVESALVVRREVLESLPERLLAAQATFGRTGALHASGLFDQEGALLVCREDVGRHNAVDKVIGRTGALHAAALFEPDGTLRSCREDVGRHNAVDKAIGRAVLRGEPLAETLLLVSGRTSFEILQKAAVAGIPVVCAISGPTTLAIETARSFNITLVNFLRGRSMNIASAPERIVSS